MKTALVLIVTLCACGDPSIGTWIGKTTTISDCSNGATYQETQVPRVSVTADGLTVEEGAVALCRELPREGAQLLAKHCTHFELLRYGQFDVTFLGGSLEVNDEDRLAVSLDLWAYVTALDGTTSSCASNVSGLLYRRFE